MGTATKPMLKCDACGVLITQQEADEAWSVYRQDRTYCPACAAAFAEGEKDDDCNVDPE